MIAEAGSRHRELAATPHATTADPGPAALFGISVYQRGALTLHALRMEVGDDPFFEILRTWADRYAYGNATTNDFIALAEEVAGRDLDPLFDAWLKSETLPDLPRT
jgi:aminopeptidase N